MHKRKVVQKNQFFTFEEVSGKKKFDRSFPLVSQHPVLQDALTLVSKTHQEKKKKKKKKDQTAFKIKQYC